MGYRVPQMYARTPGVGRYLWQSALIHLCVIGGLTLL
jgi:hypothetical protein